MGTFYPAYYFFPVLLLVATLGSCRIADAITVTMTWFEF
jgi:hypothetical protein